MLLNLPPLVLSFKLLRHLLEFLQQGSLFVHDGGESEFLLLVSVLEFLYLLLQLVDGLLEFGGLEFVFA